jgi:flagellar biosynthesis/type III secretory pathway chaperone
LNFEPLVQTLDEQIKVYRHLLDVVRKEKEILVSANLDDLNENNRTKEAMLIKIRALEAERIKYASLLSVEIGLPPDEPRLLEIARQMGGDSGEKLRSIHSVLELLLRRVQEFNQANEILVQSALNNITGAMNAIRGTLQEKSTYQRKGEVVAPAGTNSGQIVSREA